MKILFSFTFDNESVQTAQIKINGFLSYDEHGQTHLLWRSWGVESSSAHQEGVGPRLPVLHVRIVSQDDVVEELKELLVSTRLQIEGHAR